MPDPLADEGLFDASDEASASATRRGLDPLTRRFVMLSAILVVAVLVTTGAIVYFASSSTKVPRTAVERDAIVAEQQVAKTPKDAQAWVKLASAEIAAGRYDQAEAAIKGVSALTKRAIVLLLKGDLAAAKGDISGARGYYTQAATQAKKDYEADAAKAGVASGTVPPSQAEIEAYVALGRLDLEVKDYQAAVKHLQAALKLSPNAADGLAMLGDAQAGAGQTEAARASYTKALQYVPDYQPALDGLKRLKGGK